LVPNKFWAPLRRKLLKSADNFGQPCSYQEYIHKFNDFKVDDFTLKLLMFPEKHAHDFIGWQKLIILFLSKLPVKFIKDIVSLSPTYIFLLFKKN